MEKNLQDSTSRKEDVGQAEISPLLLFPYTFHNDTGDEQRIQQFAKEKPGHPHCSRCKKKVQNIVLQHLNVLIIKFSSVAL